MFSLKAFLVKTCNVQNSTGTQHLYFSIYILFIYFINIYYIYILYIIVSIYISNIGMILLQEATRYIAMGVKYVLRNFPGCFNINKSMGTLYDIFMILRLCFMARQVIQNSKTSTACH